MAMQVYLTYKCFCPVYHDTHAHCYGGLTLPVVQMTLCAVMQLLVVVVAEAGRHLLSEGVDILSMSRPAHSKCRL